MFGFLYMYITMQQTSNGYDVNEAAKTVVIAVSDEADGGSYYRGSEIKSLKYYFLTESQTKSMQNSYPQNKAFRCDRN